MRDCFIFSAFSITVDTAAGAKPRELQTLARFSSVSIFLNTNIIVSNVVVFLVLFTPFCRRGNFVFLMDNMGGKITINLKELH